MIHVVHRARGGKANPRHVAAVFLALALLALGSGAYLGLDAEGILGNLGTAEGRLLVLEQRKGGERPRATVKYDAEGSTVYLLHQRVSREAREGDPVTVHYDRRDPAHATLRSPRALRAGYGVLIGAGAVGLVIAALAFALGGRRVQARSP